MEDCQISAEKLFFLPKLIQFLIDFTILTFLNIYNIFVIALRVIYYLQNRDALQKFKSEKKIFILMELSNLSLAPDSYEN